MKILISILIVCAATLASHANAATDAGSTDQTAKSKSVVTKVKKAKAKNTNPNSKLSTDISFDGQVVGGKTQSPFESMAVIENEKQIDDLIGVRTSFNDRSKKAQGMR
ncbi:MAG: hypothetical protein H7256_05910 [Bdellovibrio sp.]|nr:hypothetical protein [Bdellovibrio sp.]